MILILALLWIHHIIHHVRLILWGFEKFHKFFFVEWGPDAVYHILFFINHLPPPTVLESLFDYIEIVSVFYDHFIRRVLLRNRDNQVIWKIDLENQVLIIFNFLFQNFMHFFILLIICNFKLFNFWKVLKFSWLLVLWSIIFFTTIRLNVVFSCWLWIGLVS